MGENTQFLHRYADTEEFALDLLKKMQFGQEYPALGPDARPLTPDNVASHVTGHAYCIVSLILEASMDERTGVELDMRQVVEAFRITNAVLEAYSLPAITANDIEANIPVLTGISI